MELDKPETYGNHIGSKPETAACLRHDETAATKAACEKG